MNKIYQHYQIDLSGNNNFVQYNTVQGDGNGVRGFEIELTEKNKPYVPGNDVEVFIAGTKPDTKQIFNSCEVTEQGTILVDVTTQMSAVAGRGYYQIVLISKTTNKQLKSFPFIIYVKESAFHAETITSSNEFHALNGMVNKIESTLNKTDLVDSMLESSTQILEDTTAAYNNALKSLKKAQDAIATAESINSTAQESAENAKQSEEHSALYSNTAQSYAVGTNNEIRENDALDNAKYYKEQAESSSASALQSANLAGQKATDACAAETNTQQYAANAYVSETNAKESEENAAQSAASAVESKTAAEQSALNAKASEKATAESAKNANQNALLAESYFHGGTGIREGEDEENVITLYEKVQAVADLDIATEAKAGLVKASDDVHVTTDGTMSIPKLSELENLIKGASSAKVCEDLEDMVTQLNNASLADFTVGTNILIKAVDVPDFWVSEVYTENIPYAWTNDEDFINNLHPVSSPTENSLQVGYYGISFLETDKVDLTGIAKESYVDQKFTEAQTFLEAETRENIVSGEKLSTIFGKIKKWFSDLKTVAFTGSYNDLTNRPDIPTIPSSLPANGGNADTVDDFHASQTRNAGNTCVVRDGSGYTHLNYINSDTSRNENGVVSQIITTNDTDDYYRKVSLGHLKSQLNVTKGDVGLGNVTNTEQMPMSYWHWDGQGGQPACLWGGNNPNDYYVYNPANFNVNRANALTYYAFGSFAEIPVESLSKAISVFYSGSDPNAPETDTNVYWWNVFQFGEANRLTQIASGAYHHMKRGLYARTKHDGNWSGWFYMPTQNEIGNTNVKQHTIQFAQGGAGTFTSEISLIGKGFSQPPVVNFRGTNGNAGYYFDILDCSVNRVLVRVERRFGSGNDSDAFIAYMIGI